MDIVDRRALGDFLRTQRERQDPREFGFEDEGRRTPGLRREEVARLADVSTIHYTNIEQARGANPSPLVLTAIARGLRLDAGQTRHLFDLARQAPPLPSRPEMRPSPDLQRLLQTLEPTPALVLGARFEVLAQNHAATELLEDFAAAPPERRNLIRRHFLPGPGDIDDVWTSGRMEKFSRFATAQLRRTATRYPDDEETIALVAELQAQSGRFEEAWAEAHTGFRDDSAEGGNRIRLGDTTVACDVMLVPDRDQYVVFLTPEGLQVATDTASPSSLREPDLNARPTGTTSVPGSGPG